jgi:hypothetical protein
MLLHRPEPVLGHNARPLRRTTDIRRAVSMLQDGTTLVVSDNYDTGLAVLAEIRHQLDPPSEHAPYPVRRAFRHAFQELSDRLLAPVVRHRIALDQAPSIGFLAQLYPNQPEFALPFDHVHRLQRAWHWYRKGIHLSVLGHNLHPFYGTYVPKRVSHLTLFATWLSQYQGSRVQAVDVGTGCGVLALLLAKAGFERVLATDCNPNAIESVSHELRRLQPAPPIELFHGDLLGDDPGPVDLIVFNPPWLQGRIENLLDRALYYEDGLFQRFFDQADSHLAPDGRVVLIFSNLTDLVQPDVPHPIRAELERGRFTLVKKLRHKVRPSPTGEGGQTRRTRERVEVWELARP